MARDLIRNKQLNTDGDILRQGGISQDVNNWNLMSFFIVHGNVKMSASKAN